MDFEEFGFIITLLGDDEPGTVTDVTTAVSTTALSSYLEKQVDPQFLKDISATNCSICMEDYEIGDLSLSLPCHHHYHSPCIKEWLSAHHTCPICRFELPRDQVHNHHHAENSHTFILRLGTEAEGHAHYPDDIVTMHLGNIFENEDINVILSTRYGMGENLRYNIIEIDGKTTSEGDTEEDQVDELVNTDLTTSNVEYEFTAEISEEAAADEEEEEEEEDTKGPEKEEQTEGGEEDAVNKEKKGDEHTLEMRHSQDGDGSIRENELEHSSSEKYLLESTIYSDDIRQTTNGDRPIQSGNCKRKRETDTVSSKRLRQ